MKIPLKVIISPVYKINEFGSFDIKLEKFLEFKIPNSLSHIHVVGIGYLILFVLLFFKNDKKIE